MALLAGLRSRWPTLRNGGIYACRQVRGGSTLSFHGEGRAADAMTASLGHPDGTAAAEWLVTHAEALGVQEVIWDRRRWDSKSRTWKAYSGQSNHRDHVHTSQCRAAAATLTAADVAAVDAEEDDVAKVWIMGTKDGDPLYVVDDRLTVRRKIHTDNELADLKTLWKESETGVLNDGKPRYVSAALLGRIPLST